MSAQDSCGPFFALAAATDELVFVWNVTGEMLWVNPSFERETGMNAADYGFRNADNPFIHPEDLPRVLAAINRFIDSDANSSPPIDNRFFDMWGRCRRLRSTIYKIDWSGESVLMFVSRFIDRPEDDSDSNDRYRRLVEAADDEILQLDGKGRIATANRRMHDLTGRRHIEMIRRPLANLFEQHDRDRDCIAQQLVGDHPIARVAGVDEADLAVAHDHEAHVCVEPGVRVCAARPARDPFWTASPEQDQAGEQRGASVHQNHRTSGPIP